eukprot:4625361-Pleurochrysis_carterae.AAC.3
MAFTKKKSNALGCSSGFSLQRPSPRAPPRLRKAGRGLAAVRAPSGTQQAAGQSAKRAPARP